MNSTLAETLGIAPSLFHYVVLPLFIFIARILDVSTNTIRIIFMLQGKKGISTILGFFESMIWILAISQIFQNLSSWPTYIAYASGFACGILVGMVIEEKLAIGRVVVRTITQVPANELIKYLTKQGYRYSSIDGISADGQVNILFTVVKRENLKSIIDIIRRFNPNAYYTIEGVKRVSDDDYTGDRGFLFRKNIFQKDAGQM